MSAKSNIALTKSQMQAYTDKRNEEALKVHAEKVARYSDRILTKQSDLRRSIAEQTKAIADEQRALLNLEAPKVLTIGDLFGKEVEAAVTPSAAVGTASAS